eukprot:jgi/Galph1/3844/GphlegSOOS_G2477.1
MTCIICLEGMANVRLLPCGHQETCTSCTILLDDRLCPVCRILVTEAEVLNCSNKNNSICSATESTQGEEISWKGVWCLSCITNIRNEEEETIWNASKQVLLTGSSGLPLTEFLHLFLKIYNPPKQDAKTMTGKFSKVEPLAHKATVQRNEKKAGSPGWDHLKNWWFTHLRNIPSEQLPKKRLSCHCKERLYQCSAIWGLYKKCQEYRPNVFIGGQHIRLYRKHFWEWLRALQNNERLMPGTVFLVFSDDESNDMLNEALKMYDLMHQRYRDRFRKFPKIFFLYMKMFYARKNEEYISRSHIQQQIYQRTHSRHPLVYVPMEYMSGKWKILDWSGFEKALQCI